MEEFVRYLQVIETEHGAISVLDCTGHFVMANQRFLNLMKVPWRDFIGTAPWDYSPPEQQSGENSYSAARAKIARAAGGSTEIFTFMHVDTQDHEFKLQVTLGPITLDQTPYLRGDVEVIEES